MTDTVSSFFASSSDANTIAVSPSSSAKPAGYPELKVFTVLIGHQDEIVRDLLALSLKAVGAQVLTASSASEVITLLESHSKVDIAVMDIEQDDINGIKTSVQIRTKKWMHMNMPIVGHSACSDQEAIHTALNWGIDRFVPITCNRHRLFNEMVAAVNHSQRLPN